jgi:hypothetical protein
MLEKKLQTVELPEPVVLDWGSVIHKEARTKDGYSLGYIAAEDGYCIYILSSSFREYRIPKSRIVGFDGSRVLTDLHYARLARYQIH